MPLPKYYEDLTEEMAAYLRDQHPRGQIILDAMPRRGEIEEDVPPYDQWTLAELKTEATNRGLKSSGTKDDLAIRLLEHDEAEGQG